MSSSDNPKFYKSDVIPLLQERNELKERVLELEERVRELEEELKGLKTSSCTCIQKLYYGPTCKSKGQTTSSAREPTPVSVLNKPMRASVYAESYLTDVLVSGYTKKERKYVYIIKETWSDGQRFEVFRSYGDLFTFRNYLLQQFPEHAKLRTASSSIPPLSSNTWNLLRINTATLTKARLGTINTFCQILVLQTVTSISRSSLVLQFFKPAIGDTQLSRLKKRSDIDLSILSVYPQSTPAGNSIQQYTVLADYTGESENELTAKAGDIVAVIHKLDTGWWLASMNGPEGKNLVGFISKDFLRLNEDKEINFRVSNGASQSSAIDAAKVDSEMKYVAIEDYSTTDPRQLSFKQGDLMIILEKSEDGWWLAVLNVRQGWVPSSYLIPHENPTEHERDIPSKGEEHVAVNSYRGLLQEDISFPKGAIVEVLDRDSNGWCVVRYLGKVGVAPCIFLSPRQSARDVEKSVSELKQSFSGLVGPPPRSKRFSHNTQRRIHKKFSGKSSPHTSASPILAKATHKD